MVGTSAAYHSRYVFSPDGAVCARVSDAGGVIRYRLSWHGEEMVGPSELSILPGAPAQISGGKVSATSQSWKPVWGQFSRIEDCYIESVLDLDLGGVEGRLYVRVYDRGVGFRYELSGCDDGANPTLYCEYNLAGDNALYSPAGEGEPLGPLAVSQLKRTGGREPRLRMPIVVERPDNKYLAILESDLVSTEGFGVMSVRFDRAKGKLASSNRAAPTGAKLVTPWRVILLGETAGDLVVNTVPVNLAAPCQIDDSAWIKPGKTLWDWRVHGYTAPDGFVYGINTESHLRFIDFAAANGIEYFLIDDAWYTEVSSGRIEMSDKLDLQRVADHAREKGVDLILYYDRRKGDYGDETLFEYYRSLGMKGIKYGFMRDNVPFSRNAIRQSAESHLLIDFHDSPAPLTGVRRTYPNAVTREYCHAQQDARRAFTPEAFIKMALINAIQGPVDMNNGCLDIDGINRGERQKGPRKRGSYLTTVVSEVARTLIIFSGLVCIPDAPEAYAAKADLFEFIRQMPVGRWDESRVLHSKIGHHICTARRHGNAWFIGAVVNQKGDVLSIDLDFLREGIEYDVTFYEDTEATHCKANPEAYRVRKGKVRKGDTIQARMAPGGGHAMWIRPAR